MSAYNLYARAGASAAALSSLLLGASTAKAALTEDSSLNPVGGSDFSGGDDFKTQFLRLANNVVGTILIIAGVLAVLYLVYSGVQYITSAGNPEKSKGARQGIINAVIGIIVISSAYLIIQFAVSGGTQLNGALNG